MSILPEIRLDEGFNYIAVFLTFRCNYKCSYCINKHSGSIRTSKHLSAEEWIDGLNRLRVNSDLPITLQGGEPTIHPGFYEIVNGIRSDTHIDLLTNLQFDVRTFARKIEPNRIRRKSPYASIRVSYHPEMMDLDKTMVKVLELQKRGYSIGLFGVLHPLQEQIVLEAQRKCQDAGIDFRTKEFLGVHDGRLYGHYLYPDGIGREQTRHVLCRNSEVLIDPSGFIYRCHHDVYKGLNAIGHILDPGLKIQRRFRDCDFFGHCNPCDLKIKNNRFQQFGHCSVEIDGARKEVGETVDVQKQSILV